jgi:hypothetical protein
MHFLGFICVLTALKWSFLPLALHSVGSAAQNFCAGLTPSSHYRFLTSALVCGTPLTDRGAEQLLRETGLIRLVLVSGSHLIWLDSWLQLLPWRLALGRAGFFLRGAFLLGYTFFTGFHVPVVRALLQMAGSALSRQGGWAWPRSFRTGLAGAVTWSLLEPSASDLSLQLSWACALLVQGASLGQRRLNLLTWVGVYVGLMPLLASFTTPHPLSVLLNWLSAGAMGGLMLPLCLASFVAHPLTGVTDAVWQMLLAGLAMLGPYLHGEPWLARPEPLALWLYVMLLQVVVSVLEIRIRRRQWQRAQRWY